MKPYNSQLIQYSYGKKFAVIFLYVLIPTLTLIFINKYSVNVPFWDEWELVNFFEKINSNTLTFHDLYNQHNEHRMLIPNLFFLLFAYISKWNVLLEQYFSFLLVVIIFVLVYKISKEVLTKKQDLKFHLTNIVSCILLFSLIQYENWLWGFQLAWFFISFCIVAAIFCVSQYHFTRVSITIKVIISALLCFLASFSLAHGLLSWLALFPAISCLPQKSKKINILRILLWVVFFIICSILYLYNWHSVVGHPDPFFFIQEPFKALAYWLSLLGSPILKNRFLSSIVGCILLALFVTLSILLCRHKNLIHPASLWISMGLYSILFAGLTMVGRSGYGSEHLPSRYMTPLILFLIAIIQLWQLYLQHQKSTTIYSWKNRMYQFFLGVLFFVFITNSIQTLAAAKELKQKRVHGALCLELIHVLDIDALEQSDSEKNCLKNLYPWITSVQTRAKFLDNMGWRDFPEQVQLVKNPQEIYGRIEQPENNRLEVKSTETVTISGWAILPNQPAKLVVLSNDNASSFFATGYVNLQSPESKYPQAGWSISFAVTSFPQGTQNIQAWVYDSDQEKLIKLQGEVQINVLK